ncbi:MAG: lysostaphin resistance A-like protein [Christensenellaceae bacterium]
MPIKYTSDEVKNGLISDVPLIIGTVAVIWLMIRGKTGLFGRPTKLWFLIPCLLVAVDNFPFPSYFAGKSQLLYTDVDKWLWFAGFCIFVGVFEECVFRGIVFPLLAGCFSSDKKGLIKTFFISSVIFGGMHLFNIFAGAGIIYLQAGYSTLIGGLCAFALMKTKISFSCVRAWMYDFCGLMLPKLGSGRW